MPNDAALRTMIETLIARSDLTPYFHVADAPDRVPVKVAVAEPGRFAGGTAFGQPIAFVDSGYGGKEALSIEIEPEAGGGTRIDFTYAPEGVSGSAVFAEGASAKPASVRIVEQ